MLRENFITGFDDVYTMDVRLVKIKQQIIFELMCRRKERLRMLVEDVRFDKMTGMNKHKVLASAINQLKRMSPADSNLLDSVARQVRWVLDKYYTWIE